MSEFADAVTIDVRALAPRDRHATVFSNFRALALGDALGLINDHDPRSLFNQLNAEAPGQVGWDYLEQGPEVWRVRITRQGKPHGNGQCCGSCGGH
ncbi:MAG TPA: DUF2249 domain-containing protein [Rhodocyclaceae bacterium]